MILERIYQIEIYQLKLTKKKFRLSFIKKLTRHKKKDISTIKLPLITSLSSPRIEELENEFMFTLKKINNNNRKH
jgi:hypothetical protein